MIIIKIIILYFIQTRHTDDFPSTGTRLVDYNDRLQVFKEEEEAIRVDLHEGCGRTKLFWVMAVSDAKTHKAMVEFREGSKGTGTAKYNNNK